jgi:hypothetical protein
MFSSKNAFDNTLPLTKRDDIISILYLLIFLAKKEYEQIDKNLPDDQYSAAMIKMKKRLSPPDLCTYQGQFFVKILKYAYNM